MNNQAIRDVIAYGILIAGILVYCWNEAETRQAYTVILNKLDNGREYRCMTVIDNSGNQWCGYSFK